MKQWLADEMWVRPHTVREAEDRFEERLAQAMREAEVPELPRTGELTKHIYSEHSEAAHHRRRWTQDAVLPRLRTMIRGKTTHWTRRAGTTAALLPVVEGGVMAVGDGLATSFFGPDWYADKVKPLQEAFEAIRLTQPLP